MSISWDYPFKLTDLAFVLYVLESLLNNTIFNNCNFFPAKMFTLIFDTGGILSLVAYSSAACSMGGASWRGQAAPPGFIPP